MGLVALIMLSGIRINPVGDEAAGLVISGKMRVQISVETSYYLKILF
ncbi:MAG TPA: hypothetical protein GX522_02855 [Firmicutes bacterium]|nr:hypothetical protein [Bacillota bacterium]